MKFILATHNVTLTDAIEQHVLQQIDKLEQEWLELEILREELEG